MSQAQLADLVKQIRAMATSPQTLTSQLTKESTRKKRPPTEAELRRKALLESL